MPAPNLTALLETEHGRPAYRSAVNVWAQYLEANGRPVASSGPPAMLTPPEGNAKLSKGRRPIWSLTLAPATASGYDVCPNSGRCARACVLSDSAGRASWDARIMAARILRTKFLADHPADALAIIRHEVIAATRARGTGRRRIALRLNAGSDLRWERIAPDILSLPYVHSYDYTKLPAGSRDTLGGRYRLIYSVDERDTATSVAAKASCGPIAVVLDVPKHRPPAMWGPYATIDGDDDDYRNALAPAGTAVILALKGTTEARRAAIRSGFVQDVGGPRVDAGRPIVIRRPALALASC